MSEAAAASGADAAVAGADPIEDPGAASGDDASRRLGTLIGRAHDGVVGLWSHAESEARSLRQRADSELQRAWTRLVALAGLPREETDRLWLELRDTVHQRAQRLNGQLEELARLASGLKRLSARTELDRLRRRLAALDFRLHSLERRRASVPAEPPGESG